MIETTEVVGHEKDSDGVYYVYIWVKNNNIDIKLRISNPDNLIAGLQNANSYVYGKNHSWPQRA